MKIRFILFCLLGATCTSFAQSDIELIAFPQSSYTDTVIRTEVSVVGNSEERDGGTDFDMVESTGALRYSLSHSETRDVYFSVNTYAAFIENDARFDESEKSVPDELYDVGVGGVYRQELENDWTFGATLRVGSASDKLFDSTDELYLRSMLLLRVPHLKYTSWVFVARVNTDGDFPFMPGVGYAFPLSERTYVLLGLPMVVAGGQITDRIGFFLSYFPALNINSYIDFELSERWIIYTGFKAQARYFGRAGRDDDDERIRTQDSRAFLGTSMQIGGDWQFDAKAGYIFGRTIGEGDDFREIKDNNVRLDNAGFVTGSLRVQF